MGSPVIFKIKCTQKFEIQFEVKKMKNIKKSHAQYRYQSIFLTLPRMYNKSSGM